MADLDWSVLDALLERFPVPPEGEIPKKENVDENQRKLKKGDELNADAIHLEKSKDLASSAHHAHQEKDPGDQNNSTQHQDSAENKGGFRGSEKRKMLQKRYSLRRIERKVTGRFNTAELSKALRGEVLGDDLNRLQEILLDLPKHDINGHMRTAVHRLFVDGGDSGGGPINKRSKSAPAANSGVRKTGGWRNKMSKVGNAAAARARTSKRKGAAKFVFPYFVLDFGLKEGEEFPLNQRKTQKLEITCEAGKKLRYRWFPGKKVKTHFWEVEPVDGIIKKPSTVEFNISLTVYTTMELREMLTLDVDGVGRFFFFIKLQSEKSVFGIDPSELELTVDAHTGLEVPVVLVTMREYLFKNGGLQQEGVFRLAPDESETRIVKQQLSKGTFTKTDDVNAIANLLKVWYRELPTPLLNVFSTDVFKSFENEEDCVKLFKTLEEPNNTLMRWLIDLICDVAACRDVNKMNPRNLAIVVSPNLFMAPADLDAIDGLMVSQKVVDFVLHLVRARMKERGDT